MEDQLLVIEGLKWMMELSPEGDLEYVGCQTRNTPDLPHLVEEAKADVVLVDMVLNLGTSPEEVADFPQYDGFAAIEAIRRKLGPSIKLVALTNWPFLREAVLERGADAFLGKGQSTDDLREAIRAVCRRGKLDPAARVERRAEQVLGSRQRALRWLRQPNRALGNRVPRTLLNTKAGMNQVEQLLGRIEHGVYS